MLLGDLGAEVIKIEKPGADKTITTLTLNRGSFACLNLAELFNDALAYWQEIVLYTVQVKATKPDSGVLHG